jgi:gamma-glutamyltranspeptidase/glutathione hydrolase
VSGIVRGFGGVAVSPHHHSTGAALEILAAGGNAVDAAIAANAVQGVVAPETCGVGGDLFALVHEPGSGVPHALNASGPAGSRVDADALLAAEGTMPYFGRHAVTVPGCVAGWEALAERLGTMSLAQVLAPAIRHAEAGILANEELFRALGARGDELAGQPIAAELIPDGVPPPVGTRLPRPSLARTLSRVATDGRAGFYESEVAADISEAVGGTITTDDLAAFRPEWVQPISLGLFGMTGWTIPPNTQGYLTLAALGALERFEATTDRGLAIHREVEAYRAFAWERNDVVSDPRTAPPMDLLDEERITRRAAMIDDDRAGTWPAPGQVPGGTAYLCVVDSSGMGVSLSQSNFSGLGTTIGAGRSGFLLHNRGGGFTLEPGHPNRLAPGRRPLHTIFPTLWTQGGRLAALLGTRGGHQQPQILTQVARRLWADGLEPDAAQAAPRWELRSLDRNGDDRVRVEDESMADPLRRRGHDVEVIGPRPGLGPVSVITIDASGLRTGAPDPRVRTTAAGVI